MYITYNKDLYMNDQGVKEKYFMYFFNSNIFNSLNNFDFNSEGHEMK